MRFFKERENKNKSNLPGFTEETGKVKITDLDDLKDLIQFVIKGIVIGEFRVKDMSDSLKYIEITRNTSPNISSYSVRINQEGKNGKLKVYVNSTDPNKKTEEKEFELTNISGMSDYIKKLLENYLWQ